MLTFIRGTGDEYSAHSRSRRRGAAKNLPKYENWLPLFLLVNRPLK